MIIESGNIATIPFESVSHVTINIPCVVHMLVFVNVLIGKFIRVWDSNSLNDKASKYISE